MPPPEPDLNDIGKISVQRVLLSGNIRYIVCLEGSVGTRCSVEFIRHAVSTLRSQMPQGIDQISSVISTQRPQGNAFDDWFDQNSTNTPQ